MPAAASAGFGMTVASMVLPKFFALWMIAGGWLAVTLYRRRSSLLIMTWNIGGKIGALAGLLAFGFVALFMATFLTVETLALNHGEQIRSLLRSAVDQAAAKNQDVQAQALLQYVQTPEGIATMVAFSLFLFLLLSTAGGIFAASTARRRMR